MSDSTLSMEFIERFHNMNLAVKTAHEVAAQKANDLAEACMKEVQQMKAYLDRLEAELDEQKAEVEKLKSVVKSKQETLDRLTAELDSCGS